MLYIAIFIFFVLHFSMKIMSNSWSPLKTGSADMSLVYFWWKIVFWKRPVGYPSWKILKKCFWTQTSWFIYQSMQFLMEITKIIIIFYLVECILKIQLKKVKFLGTISFLLGHIKVLCAYFLDIFLCTSCAVFFTLSNP
jgi:hypothetical protein